jgi:hypothetical protein
MKRKLSERLYHTTRLTTTPKAVINMPLLTFKEVALFDLVEVGVESVPETDPVEDCVVVTFVVGAPNCAPTFSAAALKAAKESLGSLPPPGLTGLTEKTIP